jgi:hypothetical protein
MYIHTYTLTLVPKGSFDGELDERMDHGVEKDRVFLCSHHPTRDQALRGTPGFNGGPSPVRLNQAECLVTKYFLIATSNYIQAQTIQILPPGVQEKKNYPIL